MSRIEQEDRTRRSRQGLVASHAACIALVLGQVGCATMQLQEAGTSERVLSTRQENESAGLVPEVTQDGALVHLQLKSDCHIQSYDRVETTTHYKTVNKTPGRDWAFGIGGAGLAGLGVWGIVDSSSTYPNDTSSRTYNPVGSDAVMVLGVTSLVAGAALLSVATVDVVRAQRTSDAPVEHERKSTVLGACQGAPIAGATITGRFEKQVLSLGSTNDAGALDIDVAELPPPPMPAGDLVGEPYGREIAIYADGNFVKNVSLAPAYAVWFPAWERTRTGAQIEADSRAAEARASREMQECTRWFIPIMFNTLPHALLPQDILEQTTLAGNECAVEATRAERTSGSVSANFSNECRERKGFSYCERRAQIIASGKDPRSPDLHEHRLAVIEKAQRTKGSPAVIATGRQAVVKRLKAPSTARILKEAVAMWCPSGIAATVHELDAQNSFGAMIRNKHCALVSPSGKGVAVTCDDVVTPAVQYLKSRKAVMVDASCSEFENILLSP